MNFDDTPEEAAFRAEVRAFLDANAPRKSDQRDAVGKEDLQAFLARAKAWQAKKAAAGYAAITWPKEYGGRGASPIQSVIYQQEEARYAVPRGVFEIGLGMCIPTLMAFATEDQKKRFVGPALRGEEIWCQLFSEPAAGSDVAGIRTKAERDGDDWIINGQKIWTSGAHFCDWGIIVTRSDPTVPKHKGLTFFFLNMKSPGVEVRPIKQISGDSNFNEVYFTDVRVPDAQRLGAVGDGWRVSLVTLMNERLAVGDSGSIDFQDVFNFVRGIELEEGAAIKNSGVREKVADFYVKSMGLKYTKFRTMTALSRGQTPGPEASVGKVVAATQLQELGNLGIDLMDMGGIAYDPNPGAPGGVFQNAFMYSPGLRIAGGTDEILRNIIAERVLGLPADVRVDKDVPFNQMPTGKH